MNCHVSLNRDFILRLHSVFFCLLLSFHQALGIGEIIDAINAGGPAVVDSNGIRFRADPLEGKAGIASDHGRRYLIQRVHPQDQLLYQTERYSLNDLEYEIKIPSDGDYVLVLKFSEVYFTAPGQKIFNVEINDRFKVVNDLDIFAQAGHATAHDEYVGFSVKGGKLRIKDQVANFDGRLHVQLVKGAADNPKINALYVMKGTIDDVPKLLPVEIPKEEEESLHDEHRHDDEDEEAPTVKSQFASGPKQPDPYQTQDQSALLLPIFVAIACFIPILYCLCRL